MASPKPDPTAIRQQLRDYFAALPPGTRRIAKKLGQDIRAAAPGAEDAFSYMMPAFRLNGRILCWYAAWANHVSMYPMGPSTLAAAGVDADDYETSKGTIRFPLTRPPSAALVKRLVKAQIAGSRKRG